MKVEFLAYNVYVIEGTGTASLGKQTRMQSHDSAIKIDLTGIKRSKLHTTLKSTNRSCQDGSYEHLTKTRTPTPY